MATAPGHRTCTTCGLPYRVGDKERHNRTFSHRAAEAQRAVDALAQGDNADQGGS